MGQNASVIEVKNARKNKNKKNINEAARTLVAMKGSNNKYKANAAASLLELSRKNTTRKSGGGLLNYFMGRKTNTPVKNAIEKVASLNQSRKSVITPNAIGNATRRVDTRVRADARVAPEYNPYMVGSAAHVCVEAGGIWQNNRCQ